MNLRFGLFNTALVFCGVGALAWFTGGFFHLTNVCTDCGALQDVRRVMWIPIAEVHETPLSLDLKSSGHPRRPSHDWMLVAGSGGPIRCALGGGGNLMQASRSTVIVEGLNLIRMHRGEAEADRWVNRLFDRKSTSDARMALYLLAEDIEDFEPEYAESVEFFNESQATSPP